MLTEPEPEPGPADWDVTIERARRGGQIEQKLVRTAQLLAAAVQRSRLRGDQAMLTELTRRLDWVHQLLDEV